MSLIAWSDERFAVGIESMDSQHRRLIDLINELSQDLANGRPTEGVARTLKGIVEYAQFHFDDEERLIADVSPRVFQEHRILHDHFRSHVLSLLQRLKKGGTVSAYELLNFLKDWLVTHIERDDKRLAEAVLAARPQPAPTDAAQN